MSDDAKFTRLIRINLIGGTIMLGLLVLSVLLSLVGFLPSDAGSILQRLAVGVVPMLLLFLGAWLARRERAQAAAASEARRSDQPQAG